MLLALLTVVSWTLPSQYVDGTPLPATDIDYTTIVWGSSADQLTHAQTVQGAATSTTLDLDPGTWFIAAVTTARGTDSAVTNPATVTILDAYVIKQTRDNLAVVFVGTVPDASCKDSQGVIIDGTTYHVVPRENVSWAGSVRSELVLAECGN